MSGWKRCLSQGGVHTAAILLMVGVVARTASGGEIEPRPNVTFASLALTVKGVSKAGVLLQSGSSTPAMLGWDRVASITGTHGKDAEAHRSLAERLWRLRVRAERNDLILAEPLADELVKELADAPGPSLCMALATQTACRYKRGARTSAVDSWLQWLEAGAERRGFFTDAGPIEPQTSILKFDESGLIPELHPFWLDSPAVRAFAARSAGAPRSEGARLAWLYVRAAAFEAGDHSDASGLSGVTGDGAAVALVNEIVTARIADGAARAKARAALSARLATETTGWKRQWILAGIGRSLLREPERDQKLLGIDVLLQVGGDSDHVAGDLAAVCLAEALVAAHELGETHPAASLKGDLFQRFANSPVLAWPPLRKVSAPVSQVTPAAVKPAASAAGHSGSGGTP